MSRVWDFFRQPVDNFKDRIIQGLFAPDNACAKFAFLRAKVELAQFGEKN